MYVFSQLNKGCVLLLSGKLDEHGGSFSTAVQHPAFRFVCWFALRPGTSSSDHYSDGHSQCYCYSSAMALAGVQREQAPF